MEKKFNWLGWLVILIFVIMDTLLFIVGIALMNNSYNSQEFGVFIVSSSLVLVIVGAALMPVWYHWGLGKLLPVRKCTATVVMRETSVNRTLDANGLETTNVKKFITFDLSNGDRIAFKDSCTVSFQPRPTLIALKSAVSGPSAEVKRFPARGESTRNAITNQAKSVYPFRS